MTPPGEAFELIAVTTDGGTVVTDLAQTLQVNKGSRLRRTVVTLNDPASPAQLAAAGITTRYADNQYSFTPTGVLTPQESITAFQLRYILYDPFGIYIKTLSGTALCNILMRTPHTLTELGSWYAFESEVAEFLTVVSFVAHVRTNAGKVWAYREVAVREAIEKLELRVTAGDLEPTPARSGRGAA